MMSWPKAKGPSADMITNAIAEWMLFMFDTISWRIQSIQGLELVHSFDRSMWVRLYKRHKTPGSTGFCTGTNSVLRRNFNAHRCLGFDRLAGVPHSAFKSPEFCAWQKRDMPQ